MKNILYVVWDAPESRYLEGLFLPIFSGLEKQGYKFHVLRFTWRDDSISADSGSRVAAACHDRGIAYREVLTLRKPGGIGPFFSAITGGRAVDMAVADWSIDCVMPRAIMGSIAVLHSRARRDCAIVFDADGLAADERADFSGLSRKSPVYKLLKRYERKMLSMAGSVISRSENGVAIYRGITDVPREAFFVSMNGRDPDMFFPRPADENRKTREELGIPFDVPLIVHNGSFGEKYMPELELEVFRQIERCNPASRLLILTNAPHIAQSYVSSKFGRTPANIHIVELPFAKVPSVLAAGDVGLCLIEDAISTKAVMPTKLGEFLLSGVGVLGTGVCIDDALFNMPVAYRIDPGKPETIQDAADWALSYVIKRNAFAQTARSFAIDNYSVAQSIKSYSNAIAYAFENQVRR